jgi:hypothetical protein
MSECIQRVDRPPDNGETGPAATGTGSKITGNDRTCFIDHRRPMAKGKVVAFPKCHRLLLTAHMRGDHDSVACEIKRIRGRLLVGEPERGFRAFL